MILVNAKEMRNMDNFTIEEMGVPGVVLMENAGRGAARYLLEHFQPEQGQKVYVIAGKGNNGGDGYVVARYLHLYGLDVKVCVLAEYEKISGDAKINLDIIKNMGIEIGYAPEYESWKSILSSISEADIIVDAIFGTGLQAEIRGFYRDIIEDINSLKKPVLSIDIPSGVSSDNGKVMGVAIRAELTVTFGYPKVGHLIFPGARHCGRVVVIDIGLCPVPDERLKLRYRLIEPEEFIEFLRGDEPDIHKGRRGHLLVIAGSTGKTGAATLTALGALRAGAGLVTLCIPETLNHILEIKLTEAMTEPLPDTGRGFFSKDAIKRALELAEGKSAVAIGPGISTDPETVEFVREFIRRCRLPMVIDADGLNCISKDPDILKDNSSRLIITPHPGEMSRIVGVAISKIQEERIKTCEEFIENYGTHLVLKGARTIVALPNKEIFINPTANPVLSSGGTGDVLTGLIGGFLARGLPLDKAAIAGVYIHGICGERLSEEKGVSGVLAGELLSIVPEVIQKLTLNEWPLSGIPFHEELCPRL